MLMEIREKLDAIGISSEQVDKKYVDSMTVSYGYVFSSEKNGTACMILRKLQTKECMRAKLIFIVKKKGIEENKAGAGFISCIGFTAPIKTLYVSQYNTERRL